MVNYFFQHKIRRILCLRNINRIPKEAFLWRILKAAPLVGLGTFLVARKRDQKKQRALVYMSARSAGDMCAEARAVAGF